MSHYTVNLNLSVKVLDFVKRGGADGQNRLQPPSTSDRPERVSSVLAPFRRADERSPRRCIGSRWAAEMACRTGAP